MENLLAVMNKNKLAIVMILIAVIFLLFGLLKKPEINGDGYEYLGMSISIKNHLTPDLKPSDIPERHKLGHTAENIKTWPDEIFTMIDYSAHSKSLDGKNYDIHFWMYPAFASVLMPVLYFLKLNPLKAFQFTNCLFLILMFWWLLYKTKFTDKLKYSLLVITFFSPIWFYAGWSHPEIFTFVFLYIALLEYFENRIISACFWGSFASVQNPAAILIPFFILVSTLIKKRKIDSELLFSGLVALVGLLPYLFFYWHFHQLSLLSGVAVRMDQISLDKILSLFLDLNFGLIIYIPVLFISLLYLCLKKNKLAIISLILLLCMAFVDSTQVNWNSDMNLLNRYSFWMIPVIIFGLLDLINSIDLQTAKKLFIIYLLTTGFWIIFSFNKNRNNSVNFSPIAKLVLHVCPALYNPIPEVFAEKTMSKETSFYDKLPLNYYSGTLLRKTLIYDLKEKKYKYINGKLNFDVKAVKIEYKGKIIYISKSGITKKSRD